jgi:hypothetical protein
MFAKQYVRLVFGPGELQGMLITSLDNVDDFLTSFINYSKQHGRRRDTAPPISIDKLLKSYA